MGLGFISDDNPDGAGPSDMGMVSCWFLRRFIAITMTTAMMTATTGTAIKTGKRELELLLLLLPLLVVVQGSIPFVLVNSAPFMPGSVHVGDSEFVIDRSNVRSHSRPQHDKLLN